MKSKAILKQIKSETMISSPNLPYANNDIYTLLIKVSKISEFYFSFSHLKLEHFSLKR